MRMRGGFTLNICGCAVDTCGAALVAGLLCDGDQPGLCAVKAATGVFNGRAKVIDGFADVVENFSVMDAHLTANQTHSERFLSVGVFR